MRLQLDGLSKHFLSLRGKVKAVCGVDLTIEDGEFFVLLGPSGCGKSTILNLIAGLEKPASGEILFGSRLAASVEKRVFLSPGERNVAFVFQSYALYPHLSVFENIAFPLRVARTPKEEISEAVEKVAESLGISGLLAARPAELSGGQRQRVAIGRAIVRRPDVFLLDEPLSNLDAQLRASTRAELKRLQRSLGVTTVYVTHDQVEAMTLGDRIALLKNGGVEQVGTPEELYERPVNPFVATFIGSPPMNLIETSLEKDRRGLTVMLGGRSFTLPGERAVGLAPGTCLLGIRPEHIAMGASAADAITATVLAVEPLGREFLVHMEAGGDRLAALTSVRGIEEGTRIPAAPDMSRTHFFPPGPAASQEVV